MNLSEKYRPKTFDQVVGQDKAVKVLKSIANRADNPEYPFGGHAIYITGKSGTGKSTIGKIIASTMATSFTTTTTTGRELSQKMLYDLRDKWQGPAFIEKPDGWALIIEEAHGLSAPVTEILLNLMEPVKPWVVMIFTTTADTDDMLGDSQVYTKPFLSRCIRLKLSQRDLCPDFARRAKEIAEIEGLDGKPISSYVELVKQSGNNLRMVLSQIESGYMLD